MKSFLKITLATICMSVSFAANAGDYMLGDLKITKPEIRATPKSAPVSAGYLMIKNTGSEDDTLLSANAGFAGKVQLHNMEVVDGVMRMRPQEGGIKVPAGGMVMLEKGGLHIMFMKLQEQMQAGESRKVTLKFEKAGEIEIDMDVVELGKMDHSSHTDMKHGDMKDGDHSSHADHSDNSNHGDHGDHGDHGKMKKEAAQ